MELCQSPSPVPLEMSRASSATLKTIPCSRTSESPEVIIQTQNVKPNVRVKLLMRFEQTALYFHLRVDKPLKQAFHIFATKVRVDRDTLRFRFDGEAVRDEDTPEDIGVEDGDEIEAYLPLIGG
ncbi:hypothetical protein BDN72DRAFT_647521 [Pluteus cervinus]|uniref:Uncharacterized protein n=1 Tax=Pluteus cervinus TaxID=181527 RepID=A0ACD3ATB4_9AGAR|nr:hypothetical protein BDN72DRAFT_647521 [Pluteus cervinus]